jgi:hypothetical protein
MHRWFRTPSRLWDRIVARLYNNAPSHWPGLGRAQLRPGKQVAKGIFNAHFAPDRSNRF